MISAQIQKLAARAFVPELDVASRSVLMIEVSVGAEDVTAKLAAAYGSAKRVGR
jgi:hypothetical protein